MTAEKPDDLQVHEFTDPLPTSNMSVNVPTDGKQKENPPLLPYKAAGAHGVTKVAPVPNHHVGKGEHSRPLSCKDEDVGESDEGGGPEATSADGELVGVEKSTPSEAGLQKEPSEKNMVVNGNDERAPLKPKEADVTTGASNSPAATVPNMSLYQRPGDDDDDNVPDCNEDEKGESKNAASSDKEITSKGS